MLQLSSSDNVANSSAWLTGRCMEKQSLKTHVCARSWLITLEVIVLLYHGKIVSYVRMAFLCLQSFCPDLLTKASALAQGGLTLVNNASELVGSRSSTTTISRGVQSSQAISCDPTHAILCAPEPKSMADSTSLHKHRSNHEEKPK
jgi:hypothetical protein